MKPTLTAALVLLLAAGAGSAALAQDRDHGDRGDRSGVTPQVHHGGPPVGAPGVGGQPHHPMGGPQGAPGAGGPPPMGGHAFRGREAPVGAPPVPGAAPGAVPGSPVAGQSFHGRDGRFGAPPTAGGPAAAQAQRGPGSEAPPHFIHNDAFDAERRHDRGGHDTAVARAGAPHEIIPPGGDRGWDRDLDGHRPGDPNWSRDGRHGPPQHWERGRYPPVYWAQNRFRIAPYRAPYGFFVRSWAFGDFLPSAWYAEDYWLDDFLDYGLPYPPPGYEWVRVGGDAMMIDRYTGRIVQVVRGIFW
ncbi:MAG TPA: RcnB family protein [Phenylobacterium sp.]|jgi:Ni/Co efflux regulator RcnB